MLRDSVLWDFVLLDFVRRDFVLWDFVLWDSVPDSSRTPMHTPCQCFIHNIYPSTDCHRITKHLMLHAQLGLFIFIFENGNTKHVQYLNILWWMSSKVLALVKWRV